MLSTDLPTVFAFVSFAISIGAFVYASKAIREGLQAQHDIATCYEKLQDAVSKFDEREVLTPSQTTLLELAGEVADIKDSFGSLHDQLKRLRSRVGMRELRERRANGEDKTPEEDADLKSQLRRAIIAKKGRL